MGREYGDEDVARDESKQVQTHPKRSNEEESRREGANLRFWRAWMTMVTLKQALKQLQGSRAKRPAGLAQASTLGTGKVLDNKNHVEGTRNQNKVGPNTKQPKHPLGLSETTPGWRPKAKRGGYYYF